MPASRPRPRHPKGADAPHINELADSLSTAEAVSLLSGGSLFGTAAVERLGIPAVHVTDGPAGARGSAWLTTTSLLMPCATALAASFDVAMVQRVGEALGREVRAKASRVHLAPTVNLHRTPVGGRNFEAFSEDPELTAQLAVAYVRGVQSQGVASCVKHFVGNDTEHERTSIDSRIDSRTLREVYLRPFEAAIFDAGALALMTSYNKVNGHHVDESTELMRIVRDEWGFEGIVMTDWWAMHATAEPLTLGVDLEMPGPGFKRGQLLLDALAAGDVDEEAVRAAARRILMTLDRIGGLDDPAPGLERTRRDSADVAVAREAAAAGMVLVRNRDGRDGPTLPLDRTAMAKVAVIGPNALRGQPTGGGSAIVNPHRVANPAAVLRDRLVECEVVVAEGCRIDQRTPPLDLGLCRNTSLAIHKSRDGVDSGSAPDTEEDLTTMRVIWFGDAFGSDAPSPFSARVRTTLVPDATGPWTLGLTSIGGAARLYVDGVEQLDNSEAAGGGLPGMGRPEVTVDVDLQIGKPVELEVRFVSEEVAEPVSGLIVSAASPLGANPIEEAVALATTSDVAIVVVGTNSDWESEGKDREDIGLPGDQDALVSAVAAAAPSTVVVVNAGSPVAMPWLDEVDAVLVAWFPGQEFGEALADVLLGELEPGGRLPVTFPRQLTDAPSAAHHPGSDGVALYGEGRRVGHRGIGGGHPEPLFEFGFGLGYADIEVLGATGAPGRSAVDVTLHNVSDRDGSEVVQLYVEPPAEDATDRPERLLVGFEKIHVPARELVTARVPLIPEALRTWDEDNGKWRMVATGTIDVQVARSVGRVEQVLEIVCPSTALGVVD